MNDADDLNEHIYNKVDFSILDPNYKKIFQDPITQIFYSFCQNLHTENEHLLVGFLTAVIVQTGEDFDTMYRILD